MDTTSITTVTLEAGAVKSESSRLAYPNGVRRRLVESDWWAMALLMLLIGLIAVPVLRHWVSITGDYAFHSVLADQMRKKRAPTAPHFLYHAVLVGVQRTIESIQGESNAYSLSDLSQTVAEPGPNLNKIVEIGKYYGLASIVTSLLFVELLGIILWLVLRRTIGVVAWGQGWLGRILAVFLTLGFLLAGPISALVWLDHRMYLGYIALNVWHSPTVLVAKPLALLSFFYTAAMFRDRSAIGEEATARPKSLLSSSALILGGALVTILSTLAKPNYTLCLLPGVALFMPWALYKQMKIRWTAMMLGLIIPAVVVLGWQYYFNYKIGGIRQNSIVFKWLLAMSLLSPKYLLSKFFLSIAFPGIVWIVFFRGVWADRRMVLAWLVFDCSAAWMYLAAESVGPGDGNFTWGAQVALLSLFLESMRFLLAERLPGTRAIQPQHATGWLARSWQWSALALCTAVFMVHVGYGVGYYIRVMNMLSNPRPGWW